MVTTSTPAALRAVKAVGGARNVNCLGAGVPPVVIAVSRLRAVMSALRSTAAMGPRAVRGFRSSRARSTPSKCTSPAKEIVYGRRTGFGEGDGVGSAAPVAAGSAEAPGTRSPSAAEQPVRRRAYSAARARGFRITTDEDAIIGRARGNGPQKIGDILFIELFKFRS